MTTTTEPKSRPSRTERIPAKFKDFVLDKWTILKDSTGAETPEDRVVPPSVADMTTTTEPKSRPSRTERIPAKFKDFVLDKWTILKDSALLRLLVFRISEQFLRDNTPFRLFIES